MNPHYLQPLFAPHSIAVFGASERPGAVGTEVFSNLLGSYRGKLFAINPGHETVQGHKAYAGLEEIAEPIDLAVIATPASTVPGIIEACGQRGVKGAVILSAGFAETGEAGRLLESAVQAAAQRHGVRFIGPNCLGMMRPSIGLNATFNKGLPSAGRLALVSQSGALCTAILDWAAVNGVGFSSVISMGAAADVDFGEILDFLHNDAETGSILLYIEGIRQSRRFMSALRAAAKARPVIAIKVGRHPEGLRAAKSHTGAMVGADDVFDAAIRRAGIVRVQTVEQLFAVAHALAEGYHPSGNRLAIVTNGGGPGVMAIDRAVDLGVPPAGLSASTMARLDAMLPTVWSHANPVDIVGDAPPERFAQAVACCLEDDGVDGVLVILTPQAMTRPTEAAQAVIGLARKYNKPVLACWMGETQVDEAHRLFETARIPAYRTPEPAVETFAALSAWYRNQRLLTQVPEPIAHPLEPDMEGARLLIEGALAEQRTVLSEMESKALLAAFHIPVAQTALAHSPNEALQLAEQFGFPVALKVYSPDITHKTDVGGVRLGLANALAVRAAYHDILDAVQRHFPQARIEGIAVEPMLVRTNGRELMIGVLRDPVWGPVITFGAGGVTVEVLHDRAVALPPLNAYLVRDMIQSTHVSKLLGAFRHLPPVDMAALEAVLLRVSEMVCELPALCEMDINPLIVDEAGACAVDARVIVDLVAPTADRYAHMAIYPYPSHLVMHWQLPDGTGITLRPIRPEDAGIEQAFVRGLSDQSRFLRFMDMQQELPPAMLARFTQIDYDREMALIATVEEDGAEVQVGVARYIINPDGASCEFAIVVADAWQGRGVGHKLLAVLIDAARNKGLAAMEGDVLAANANMLQLCRALGFEVVPDAADAALRKVVRKL